MSAFPGVLRRRFLRGGALPPTLLATALIGVPAATAGPAAAIAPNPGVGRMCVFGAHEALPENPELLRQQMWMDFGAVPAPGQDKVRVATFSTGLSRSTPGRLADELAAPGSAQAERVAETVQRAAPDVVLLTDFDVDTGQDAARSFQTNYLAVGTGGQRGIEYPHIYTSAVNNGVDTGADLDDDGVIGGAGDSFGPGEFAGQHGMVLFSRHPLDTERIRTFQHLRWDQMPGNSIPQGRYTDLERSVLRLSSTAHWDIPVQVEGRTVHVLAAQPVDPGAGPAQDERHHDEMRFWADYIVSDADYLVDDDGRSGGLEPGADFVLLGDFGPRAGQALSRNAPSAIATLLDAEAIQDPAPESAGARAADRDKSTATRFAHDEGGPLLSRSDYVLPSTALSTTGSGVFWPAAGQVGSHLTPLTTPAESLEDVASAGAAQRRLVWTDLELQQATP